MYYIQKRLGSYSPILTCKQITKNTCSTHLKYFYFITTKIVRVFVFIIDMPFLKSVRGDVESLYDFW